MWSVTTEQIVAVVEQFTAERSESPTFDDIVAVLQSQGVGVDFGDLQEQLEMAVSARYLEYDNGKYSLPRG